MPFFTFLAGAAGFYIRFLERLSAYDAQTGLPERGATITYVLIAFSAVFLVVVLMFSIRVTTKHKVPSGFENAFGTDPTAYPVSFALIGLFWLAATVLYYLSLEVFWPLPTTDLIFILLSALSAISVAFFAIEMFQDPNHKSKYALSIIPSIFVCFWLVVVYRQNASNPVLLSYCYQCLAIISSALGFYFTSGFVFNKPAPGKTVFCYSAAAYFCFVSLADEQAISLKLIVIAMIAVNVIHSSMLIRHLQWKEG